MKIVCCTECRFSNKKEAIKYTNDNYLNVRVLPIITYYLYMCVGVLAVVLTFFIDDLETLYQFPKRFNSVEQNGMNVFSVKSMHLTYK